MVQAEEAWQQARTAQSSVVSDVFEGQLQSTLSCGTCGARSHNFEVFQDLSLPLPQDASPAGVPSIQARELHLCISAHSVLLSHTLY